MLATDHGISSLHVHTCSIAYSFILYYKYTTPQTHTQRTHNTQNTAICNHHHTVQVAKRAHSHVCTLVNASFVDEKHTSASCSGGGSMVASHVCMH